ncbi:hypothetical protein ASD83_04965 [Devosia sp. Root685]|nr:hypothetical protein ASD83_04965 [Devosia sp. Root685]
MRGAINKTELREQSIITLPRLIVLLIVSFLLIYFARYWVSKDYVSIVFMTVIGIWATVVMSIVSTISYLIVDVLGYRIDTALGNDRYMISKSPLSSIIIREFIR